VCDKLEGVLSPDLTGINKHFAIIIITHISHNIPNKINTPLAQLTTAIEVLNIIKTPLNLIQQKYIASINKQRKTKI
jgi:hypothetical protein